MPLIMMCGIPSSGKTTRALELRAHLEGRGTRTHLVNEESMSMIRSTAYKGTEEEKMTRSMLRAEIERNLTNEVIVIADSMNYIKGCRYELYCLARAAGTAYGVIYCDTAIEQIDKWNSSREGDRWEEEQLRALVRRFERPNPDKRWDRPCITVVPEQPLPAAEILEQILTPDAVSRMSYATQQHSKLADADHLFNVEKAMQQAIQTILEASRCAGQRVTIQNSSVQINLIRNVTMAELRRLKRQYLTLTRQMTNTQADFVMRTEQQALDGFLEYVNAQIAESI